MSVKHENSFQNISVFGNEMYDLRPDMTSYLKESLSVSIGCYGPTLMH